MKRCWNFISSTYLSVILIAIICAITIWGSFLAVKYRWFYEVVDKAILLPWLAEKGREYFALTHWIYALIIFSALFALNTTACTLDKLYAIYKHKRPWQSLLPQLVHVGFLIAMLGHLLGSAYGFRAHDVLLYEGVVTPIQGSAYSARLDSTDVKFTRRGSPSKLSASLTVFKDNAEVKSGVSAMNSPLITGGRAFYLANAGEMPVGLFLTSAKKTVQAPFNSKFSFDGKNVFMLGTIYPELAFSSSGEPYSASDEMRNPHIEVRGAKGETAYLPLDKPGDGSVIIGNARITLDNYMTSPYAVVNVSFDPGIYFIIIGSAVLSLGMLLLFVYRGERGELLSRGGA